MGYIVQQLYDLMYEYELSERWIKNILAEFSCPLDQDIDDFIHTKAYDYERVGLARTYLVYTNDNEQRLCGIFSLSTNSIKVNQKISRANRKQIFGTSYPLGKNVSTHLIGQLSKNYKDENGRLISGKELLHYALEVIKTIDTKSPSPVIRIDCKDDAHLRKFYEENGFVEFKPIEEEKDLLMYLMPTKKLKQDWYLLLISDIENLVTLGFQ